MPLDINGQSFRICIYHTTKGKKKIPACQTRCTTLHLKQISIESCPAGANAKKSGDIFTEESLTLGFLSQVIRSKIIDLKQKKLVYDICIKTFERMLL